MSYQLINIIIIVNVGY